MGRLVAVLVAFAAVMVPETALGATTGLQPGVHVDPGSPAGKEYQIPIDAARGQAAGGAAAGSSNPPLFGVGVTAPSRGLAKPGDTTPGSRASDPAGIGAASDRGPRRGTATHRGSSAGQTVVSGTGSAEPARQSASQPPAPGSSTPGESGWIALVGGGLLVLVLGGGGGMAIRHRALRS